MVLVVEAAGTSETSVIYQTTRRNIPDESHLYIFRREDLKSHQLTKCLPANMAKA
jgi:hypothetical protein